jgi:hypothetical protein
MNLALKISPHELIRAFDHYCRIKNVAADNREQVENAVQLLLNFLIDDERISVKSAERVTSPEYCYHVTLIGENIPTKEFVAQVQKFRDAIDHLNPPK